VVVRTGIEKSRNDDFRSFSGRRVGLMTNPSGIDREFRSTVDILRQALRKNLVALFSPEHGLAAAAPDAEKVESVTDQRTGLPIYSLYGDTYRPTDAMLADVDVIVCDVQDVGVRFYTYVWTVSHILEAAGAHGVEVVILDRPNPLDGISIAGPLITKEFTSFVGRFPIPIQHGLTLGELAQMVNALWNPSPTRLTVIPCEGWSRDMTWADTGLPWVPTSPAIPHDSTVQQYPGACLVEGTRLSEGRGTALPFEVVGVPWINAVQLADHLNAQAWPGVVFRPHTFMPTDSKWRGETCHGVQVHITDIALWRPVEVWLGVIREIRAMYPDQFEWLPPHSAGVETGDVHHFDRLIGSDTVRHQIEAGASLTEITAGWDAVCREFEQQRAPYLLYE
jgi:uncharacterized protein YbbC (DUF1343 family)